MSLVYDVLVKADRPARRNLETEERRDFIEAVQCLQTQPSVYPVDVVPGAKSVFDDFVAVHMNQTPYIHISVRDTP